MRSRPWVVRALGTTAFLLLGVVLACLLWWVPILSQSRAGLEGAEGVVANATPTATPNPDSWVPPEIYKYIDDKYLGIGDPVTFNISVINVDEEPNEVTWYEVTMSDEIPPEFEIEDVTVDPPGPTPVIIGNRVEVTVPSLALGQWFAVDIVSTLVGPADWYEEIINEAGVMYTGPDDHEQGPQVSSDTIRVHSPLFLPLVVKSYSPLLGTPTLYPISNPSGLNAYVVDWSAVPTANTYRLQEALRSDFSDATLVYNGPQTQYSATAQQPTRYYYRVRAHNNYGHGNWSNVEYTDVLWELEPNDDGLTQANGPILSGLTYHGTMPNTGDQKDYYYFELTGGNTVELWLNNIPAGENFDLVLREEDLTWIVQSTNPGNAPEHIYQDGLEPGIYKIQVYHSSGPGSSQPYNLTADFD